MTDTLRERIRDLRTSLYTAVDQWHKGGPGPQLEAILPIVEALVNEQDAKARRELREPMECGHAYANLGPSPSDDPSYNPCLVCQELKREQVKGLRMPLLWAFVRCKKHEYWESKCALCEEEILTAKTECAYRAGFAAAVNGPGKPPTSERADFEAFTRGRNWEISEYKRHLIEHNPQIGGLCSWCKMEVEAGRIVGAPDLLAAPAKEPSE